MEPFRLRVLKALTEALEGINPDNGYQHDLRGSVYRGRDLFTEDDQVPMVSILEAPKDLAQIPAPVGGSVNTGGWELLVQGFVEDDFVNPTDPAHYLMAEVKKCLTAERIREKQYNILGMGGKITEITLSPGVVRPPDEVSGKAYFWLRVTLTLVENLIDPFE